MIVSAAACGVWIALPPLAESLPFVPAALACIAAPGPDMLLAASRGLGQGRLAALVSALGTALGIVCHSLLLALGLTALLQQSVAAFTVLKLVGACYLVWIGVRTIRSRPLISLDAAAPEPLHRVLFAGWLANQFNPKVAVFVLAFIPQFVDRDAGPVAAQLVALGLLFAGLTIVAYGALGCAANSIRSLLQRRRHWLRRLNLGAGAMLIASGLGVLALRQR